MLWLPDELIMLPSYTPFRGHRNLILLPSKERIALAFLLITLTLLSASQETSKYAISLLHNELYNFKLFVSTQGTWVLSKTKGIGSTAARAIVSLKLRHHEDSVSVTMDLTSSVGSSLTLNLSANISHSLPPKDFSVGHLSQQTNRKRIRAVDSKNKKVPT